MKYRFLFTVYQRRNKSLELRLNSFYIFVSKKWRFAKTCFPWTFHLAILQCYFLKNKNKFSVWSKYWGKITRLEQNKSRKKCFFTFCFLMAQKSLEAPPTVNFKKRKKPFSDFSFLGSGWNFCATFKKNQKTDSSNTRIKKKTKIISSMISATRLAFTAAKIDRYV